MPNQLSATLAKAINAMCDKLESPAVAHPDAVDPLTEASANRRKLIAIGKQIAKKDLEAERKANK